MGNFDSVGQGRTGGHHNFNIGMNPMRKLFIVVIIILVIAYATALTIINSMNPTIERQARVIAKSTAESLSNRACQQVMQNLKYEDLCNIQKDGDGNVTMLNLNVINVNKVGSSVATLVQQGLMNSNNANAGKIRISLGSLSGNKVLAGKGPNITIKVNLMGNVQTSVKSELKEAGINQALHKIYLDVDCQVSIISPYKDTDEQIHNEILLAESVIVGKIPQTYYNLHGLEKSDTLNMIGG